MKLSIIIPTLNEEKYIGILLDSLCEQTFKDFEVIVSDFQSTDKTAHVANSYADKLDIRFLNCPQKGVAFQRNFGASQAKFDYLMFIDADGYIKPDFLEKVNFYVEKNPKTDMFVTWTLPLNKKKIYRTIFYTFNIMFMEMMKNISPVTHMGGFNFVKKSVFEKLGGYDSTHAVAEDHDLIERAFRSKFIVKLLRRPVVYTSVRRIEKEGVPKFLFNISKAGYYHYVYGGVTENLTKEGKVDYKMEGGTYYDETKN